MKLKFINEHFTEEETEYISKAVYEAIYEHPDFQKNYPNHSVVGFNYNVTVDSFSVEEEE